MCAHNFNFAPKLLQNGDFSAHIFLDKNCTLYPRSLKKWGGICRPTPTSYSGAAQHSWYKTVQQTEFPSAKTECEFCMQRASTQG